MRAQPGKAPLLLAVAALATAGLTTAAWPRPSHAGATATAQAHTLSDAFAAVAERISPAVVSVRVELDSPAQSFFGLPLDRGGQGIQRGGGSGVLVRSDGAVLTNYHVIEHARRIDVKLKDGRSFEAKVVGRDPATDLAVLRIDARGLPTARFADSEAARVGDWVVAIGSPFGLDYTLTAGVLSAKGRGGLGANEIEDYLQTDASINPGNSGGPLVTLDGEVLGINTMIIGRGTGIGFAIPANLARHVVDQILETGSVKRAWIGVGFQELTPELAASFGSGASRGALISTVADGGPAARAGVQSGDIVETVDGKPVREGRDLLRAVLTRGVGQRLELGVLRRGAHQTLTLTTAARPEDGPVTAERGRDRAPRATRSPYGMALSSLDPESARRMGYAGSGRVVVTGVRGGSPADRAGLRRGDVVLEADRRRVESPGDVTRALKDGRALLRMEREDGTFFTVLKKG